MSSPPLLLLTTIEVTASMTCEINSKPEYERGGSTYTRALHEDTEEIITLICRPLSFINKNKGGGRTPPKSLIVTKYGRFP